MAVKSSFEQMYRKYEREWISCIVKLLIFVHSSFSVVFEIV